MLIESESVDAHLITPRAGDVVHFGVHVAIQGTPLVEILGTHRALKRSSLIDGGYEVESILVVLVQPRFTGERRAARIAGMGASGVQVWGPQVFCEIRLSGKGNGAASEHCRA